MLHKHFYMGLSKTKQMKWPEHPAKTQISLGIHSVWSESLLYVSSETKDHNFVRMHRSMFSPRGWVAGGGGAGLPQEIRQYWKIGV